VRVTADNIAKIYSHAAFVHGVCSKWTYLVCTIPQISFLLGTLEDAISAKFLPALTGRSFSDVERSIFSLPTKLGGLGIGNPRFLSDSHL